MAHQTLKTRIHKHIWYYATFIFMQMIGFGFVLTFSGNKSIQWSFILVTTGLYIFWAIMHQYMHHTLTSKIAVEYILFGLFGLAVTFFVL